MSTHSLPVSVGRVVDRYVRAFAPERIVLFGSYAKGTHHSESDLDLLIVADYEMGGYAWLQRAHQLAADCFPPVDVVFATIEDVERAPITENPFLLSVLGTGIVIYACAQASVRHSG
jgi:predicted nucleotidyltransferase